MLNIIMTRPDGMSPDSIAEAEKVGADFAEKCIALSFSFEMFSHGLTREAAIERGFFLGQRQPQQFAEYREYLISVSAMRRWRYLMQRALPGMGSA
ncbi:hypothetical protein [Gluconacetobacter diazotrophicus]|nr:hypothetical protein [Gluconacetobacter diazotrophicus]